MSTYTGRTKADRMSRELLQKHRQTWKKKALLRFLYNEWYHEISDYLTLGATLELCAGTGNFKEYCPDAISSDVIYVPWLDAVVNAEVLPFAASSLSNIVLIDGLHHIAQVCTFFDEATRVLRSGGRMVLLEPYISLLSWPLYHFLHEEPVDFNRNPLDNVSAKGGALPFDANQAVATMLFEKEYHRFHQRFPTLNKMIHKYKTSFVYTLSGGFGHAQLLPTRVARVCARWEKKLPFPGKYLGFRLLVVLERQ